MTLVLHELCGSDPARVFSPFCWRIHMALLHKGLPFESRPWRFGDRAEIADAGADKVPVLRDGDRSLRESWDILLYLEDHYPGRPTLFGGEGGRALSRFVLDWCDTVLHPAVGGLIISDIPPLLRPADRDYFESSRTARFGRPLHEVTAGREERLPAFRKLLEPLRATLRRQFWLHGATPGAADYIVFGAFQWARCVSPLPLLEAEDPVHGWRGRLLDAFGGAARAVPAVDPG
ncbi:glutathione S-transferase family protein [Roseomonas elaeocarpi]|uniref:Glutathione S-transferase family protein n=1 Tax=Roseomonas elaeocarpi TaxID=907779 RepID=A0ABV6JW48_9PROT